MNYTRLETDYETGEVFRIDIGEHLTFSELAKKLEVSRSVLTKAMLEIGLCQREFDEVADKYRNRLHPSAVKKELGHRIMGVHGPFDVLSPIGQEVAINGLKDYLFHNSADSWRPMFAAMMAYQEDRKAYDKGVFTAQMKVCWLLDHVCDVPINVIADGLGVSEGLVYKFVRIRNSQLEEDRRLQLMYRNYGSYPVAQTELQAA